MKKVLVVSAHDTVVDSVANKYILEDLKANCRMLCLMI